MTPDERREAQHWHRLGLFADDEWVCTSWAAEPMPPDDLAPITCHCGRIACRHHKDQGDER